MSEHTVGQVGVIAGAAVAAGSLVAVGLLYLNMTKNGEVDFGPGAIGAGVCLTPLVVGVGAWFGSVALRWIFRTVKS